MPKITPKRDWSQHSRTNRTQRKLEQAAEDCRKLDEFFPVLNQLEKAVAENAELKRDLAKAMEKLCSYNNTVTPLPKTSKFLEILFECAKSNANKKTGGKRYFTVIKEFCTLCFVMGGPQLYSLLLAVFPFPSLSTCRRNLLSNDRMEECYFRIAEAKEYLLKRNLPTKVVISEDATRVNGRIQYDFRTNQIVGFVPPLVEGLPQVRSYPATSADLIKQYFESGTVSDNAYVVMLQPLAENAAPMCIALWGTDNRFDAGSVDLRWTWVFKAFADVGIQVVAFGADGDGKLLKAMVLRMFSHGSPEKWPWFQSSLTTSPVCVQDTIHILVKLKSKLVKPSEIIPMGKKNLASRGHLIELTSTVSKDQHDITKSFIDAKDKMNHRAAQKICDAKVTNLLRKCVAESEGTATYLDMMRQVTDSYLDRSLDPLSRIKMLWEWIFFLRIWRQWIKDNPQYTLTHNFISLNSYTCLEINAHALILIIRLLRDSENPELFQPWLFSSQANEKFFRKARSMTTVESTVINFSILQFICRILRIDFIGQSQLNLKDIVDFQSSQKHYRDSTAAPAQVVTLPEDFEIETAIQESFQHALQKCISLGMAKRTTLCPPCPLSPGDTIESNNDDVEIDEEIIREIDSDDGDGDDDDSRNEAEDGDDEVTEDLLMVTSGMMGLQTYNDVNVTPDSPFVKVLDGNGNPCVIRKTSLCWLLSSGDTTMSSDRLVRVQTQTASHSTKRPALGSPVCDEEVSIGDWCAFTSEDTSIIVGRVMAFSYMTGSTWRKQEYSLLTAPVKPPSGSSARGIGCLCTWFSIGKHGKLINVSMDTQGYYSIEKYICTIPRPTIVKRSLMLPCSVSEIKRLMTEEL